MFNLSPIPVPDLSGKTVLVTGAGQGIGARLFELLTTHGAQVFAGIYGPLTDENQSHLKGAHILDLDIRQPVDVENTINAIGQASGKLDVLVNNAGTISEIGPIDSLDSAALSAAFDVNVAGQHRMTIAALPLLKASRGAIVNAGTGAATTPMEGWTAYCCSKAGARMLTGMFDMELAGTGVQSFFIGIPPTDTDMQAKIRTSGLNPISQIAQDDLVDPDVPASVMAWLCSDEARNLKDVFIDVRDAFFTQKMSK